MKEIENLVSLMKEKWSSPLPAIHRGKKTPCSLYCSFNEGRNNLPIDFEFRIPQQVIDFWKIAKSAELFKDFEYGQWGLKILSIEESSSLTISEKKQRAVDFLNSDLIIGSFYGDSDLLAISCASDKSYGSIFVTSPIETRSKWEVIAGDFFEFLDKFVKSEGDKFWEK